MNLRKDLFMQVLLAAQALGGSYRYNWYAFYRETPYENRVAFENILTAMDFYWDKQRPQTHPTGENFHSRRVYDEERYIILGFKGVFLTTRPKSKWI